MSEHEESKFYNELSDCEEDYSYSGHSNTRKMMGGKGGKWTEAEDKLLKEIIDKYGAKNWKQIARYIPGRTSTQCLHRWKKILQPGLVKGPWNLKEDQLLRKWVSEHGPVRWSEASKEIKGRSGKQIRERWFNTLNPALKKGGWSRVEEQALIKLVKKFGPKWSKLMKFFVGRTENAIKNRFYCILRMVANEKRKEGTIDPKYLDPEGKELQCTSKELLDFQDEALNNYISENYELPTDLDINNPRVLIFDTQKRFKTGPHTEEIYYSEHGPPNYVLPNLNSINNSGNRSEVPIGHILDSKRSHPNPMEYNPGKDNPSYTKYTPHLNELSRNIQSRTNNSYNEVSHDPTYFSHSVRQNFRGQEIPNLFHDPSSHPEGVKQISLKPLEECFGTSHPSSYSLPVNNGSKRDNDHKSLVPNDHKQEELPVYKNTRNNVKLRIEANKGGACNKCDADEEKDEPTEKKVRRYHNLLDQLNKLENEIRKRLRK